MGIREHFEKKGEGDLKLQDLGLDIEESEELFFDVDREVTEDDKKRMVEQLTKMVDGVYWGEHKDSGGIFEINLRAAVHLAIVSSDALKDFKERDYFWSNGRIFMENSLEREDVSGFLEVASCLRILFPKGFSKLDLHGRDVMEMHGDWSIKAIYDFLIAFPDDRDYFLESLNQDYVFDNGMKEIKKLRDKNWRDFAVSLSRLRIIFPERFDEIDLNNRDWQGMKEELEISRDRESALRFFRLAGYMKILAAEKVEITDKGLEITMSEGEDFRQEKKSRPERRQF